MVKVIIADDHAVLRESIKFRIGLDENIEVVGCARDGFEALELCGKCLPDVVLMDIVMPNCNGIEATGLIKARYPEIKVIILTTFIDNERISKAMKNGADGYVLKDIDPEELINIIKNTAKGLHIIHENVFNKLVDKFNTGDETESYINISDLTDKEIDIIRLIVLGKSTREIASSIFLSEGRIKNIISEILTKLGLKDRIQLAVYAVKNNLVE